MTYFSVNSRAAPNTGLTWLSWVRWKQCPGLARQIPNLSPNCIIDVLITCDEVGYNVKQYMVHGSIRSLVVTKRYRAACLIA